MKEVYAVLIPRAWGVHKSGHTPKANSNNNSVHISGHPRVFVFADGYVAQAFAEATARTDVEVYKIHYDLETALKELKEEIPQFTVPYTYDYLG